MRRVLFYSTVMIVTYLVVARATGAGRLLSEGSSGAARVVRAFQGR